ncbi:MAG: hypothetical protein NZ938_01310 [Aigarchaeota archaeon]|nr:hypothetical protein [Candidatus Calditenuaceae archaeon]
MGLLSRDDSGGSLVFISSEEFGEFIAELRRLNVGPGLVLAVLRELERHGVLASGEKTLEILQDALSRRTGRPQPTELGESIAKVVLSGNISPEDLQTAAEALHSLARLSVTKGASSRAAERAREIVARALLPALQNHLVPRWVYRSLERTTAQLRERVAMQELELERLKVLLKRSGREVPVQRLYVVSGLLEEDPLPMEGEMAKIPCPVCRELNLFHLPREEICREAESRHLLLRLHCIYCGRAIDIEPQRMLMLVEERARGLEPGSIR